MCLAESIRYLPPNLIPDVASRISNCVNPQRPAANIGLSLGSLVKLIEATMDLDNCSNRYKTQEEKPSFMVRNVLEPKIRELLEAIIKFLLSVTESSDGLHIGVDCLQHVISLFSDGQSLRAVSDLISSACMSLWKKFPSDPLLIVGIIDCLSLTCTDPVAGNSVLQVVLPQIVAALAGDVINDVALQTSIDLLSEFLKHRNSDSEVPQILIDQVFPSLCKTLLQTADTQALQSGSECLRHFLRVYPTVLGTMTFTVVIDGQQVQTTGTDAILHTISKLLRPDFVEDAALFVGPLVIRFLRTFITQLPEAMLVQLCSIVLFRYSKARMFALQQSLLMVLVHLSFLINFEIFIKILSQVTVEGQKSAIEYFFSAFAEHHPNFYSSFDIKVSLRFAMNLCLTSSQVLDSIQVFGESLDSMSTITTRAQRRKQKHDERKVVPLKVKLFKNILAIFYDFFEDSKIPRQVYDSDDDVEDFLDGEANFTQGSSFCDMEELDLLEQLVGEETVAGSNFDEAEFGEEPLFKFEVIPLVQEFVKSSGVFISEIAGYLTAEEKKIIDLILSS
ncbi:hypothetical protein GEMRC1_008183 [Eukaryota sp. GEM-RC1]